MGIGGAVQTGYMFVNLKGYDSAVQFDGDGRHDINSLLSLLAPVIADEKDFVAGSRFLDGSSEFKSNAIRRIGIGTLSKIIWLFTRNTIKDATSGFRAANRKAIKYLSENYPDDYPEPESLVDLSKHIFRLGEVQVNMLEREVVLPQFIHGSPFII